MSQVAILDYRNDDDFVVRLRPGTPCRDDIVLAKVARGRTLEETVDAVRNRIANPNPKHNDRHFLSTESLVIPKTLTISVERKYVEIIGPDITPEPVYTFRAPSRSSNSELTRRVP